MSIARNYIYNVIYQVFILIVPLITMPYVAKSLGSDGVGINALTNSIIQYFILFGTIGVALYGNRSIAYVRDSKEELSRVFWSIFILKLITTGFAYVAFLIFLLFIHHYPMIYLLQSIYILSAALDVSWLYMGLEDFKKTVLRNLTVKVIGTICIFIFIKEPSDLWKYVLILALSEIIGQITLWAYVPKTIQIIRLKWIDVTKHFLPALSLFLPQAAIQIYAVLNKPMLGYLSSTTEVGLFDYADKIVKVTLAVVTAMGVVMLPRVSNTYANGNIQKVKEYLYQSVNFATYLSFPIMFGMIGVAQNFTSWYFPIEFSKTGLLICIISPIILFIALSNVLGIQYLLPIGKMREFTISVVVGAIINFSANLILIPHYQSVGTAIATVIAELTVTIIQLLFIVRNIEIKRLLSGLWIYLVSGCIMCVIILLSRIVLHNGFVTTVLQIIIGIIVYFSLLFLLHSELNNKIFKNGLEVIRKISRNK